MKQKVVLPGGLEIDGQLYRDVIFHPITGYIEHAIESILFRDLSSVEIVTESLIVSLERVGNKLVNKSLVEDLCTVDRQFLMLCLTIRLESKQLWLHPVCAECGVKFDIYLDRSQLPVIQASGSYPYSKVKIKGKNVSLKVPTGRDEKELVNLNNDDALQHLIRSCITSVDDSEPSVDFYNHLNEKEISKIEVALENILPSVCSSAETDCPECGSNQTVNLLTNPLSEIKSASHLMLDVHRLASHYHWNEEEIFSLPKIRRQVYLNYIDASDAMNI